MDILNSVSYLFLFTTIFYFIKSAKDIELHIYPKTLYYEYPKYTDCNQSTESTEGAAAFKCASLTIGRLSV